MLSKSLPPNCIHFWEINWPSQERFNQNNYPIPAQLAEYFAVLTPEEQARAQRFVFAKHSRRFIFAHFALHQILSRYLNLPPQTIQFTKNAHGKPELLAHQNPHHLEFNLSHSQDSAVIGLRTQKPIGVDIEYHSEREWLSLAKHSFSEQEYEALKSLPLSQHQESFFHIWAQKEAFIKAIGLGLSYPLKTFSVSALPPASLIETESEEKNQWFLHSYQPHPQAHIAIATLKPVIHIEYFSEQFDDVY